MRHPLDWITWTAVEGQTLEDALARLTARAPQFAGATFDSAQSAQLPIYPEHLLIKLNFVAEDLPEVVYGLHGQSETHWLDGKSDSIHETNEEESLALTDETVLDYIRLFFFFVRGETDAFVLIESAGDIEAPDPPGEEIESRLAEARSAVKAPADHIERLGENWMVQVTVAFDDMFFASTLEVRPSGEVEMTDDTPITSLEGFSIPKYEPLDLGPGYSAEETAGPASDRAVTQAIVAVLLGDAIEARDTDVAEHNSLLRHFNAGTGDEPIDRFTRLVTDSCPVVIIESEIPFVEEFVAGLIERNDRRSAFPNPHLLSFYNGRGIEDAERSAHDFAIEDRAALIGCERVKDVPEPLRRVADLVLTFPRFDRTRFARIFEQVFGVKPTPGWDTPGTDWTRYLVPADFHQPRRLGLAPEEALPFMRARVEARLQQVTPDVGPTLHDLQGMGEARQVCEDLLDDIEAALAGRIPWAAVDRGLLLVGPPGTGKTTLARAVAKECGVKFVVGSAAAWQASGYLDAHLRAMRADFAEARRYAPSILFIDELDSIGSREALSGQDNVVYQTDVINALLEQIQGIDTADPVIVIGATNYAEKIDPALRRAGRLDQVVAIPLPNIAALEQIFDYYLAPYRSGGDVEDGVDTRTLAGLSLGFTGADVEFFVRGASRRARRAGRKITQDDLLAAVTRRPRRNDSAPRLGPAELRRVAVHEGGHAVARLTSSNGGEDITFVTVIPRLDGSLGFVASVPSDGCVETRRTMLESLETALAGRAAEEITYGHEEVSTGAGGGSRHSDLAVATAIATELVCQSGLGSDGALRWTEKPTPAQDEQIAAILDECHRSIVARLERERPLLDRVADILVEKQELSGSELRELLDERA